MWTLGLRQMRFQYMNDVADNVLQVRSPIAHVILLIVVIITFVVVSFIVICV